MSHWTAETKRYTRRARLSEHGILGINDEEKFLPTFVKCMQVRFFSKTQRRGRAGRDSSMQQHDVQVARDGDHLGTRTAHSRAITEHTQ